MRSCIAGEGESDLDPRGYFGFTGRILTSMEEMAPGSYPKANPIVNYGVLLC